MKDEEHDDLWEFLGKARKPKGSPFFAANVMRELRAELERPRGFAAFALWLRQKWYVPATAAVCAMVVMMSLPEKIQTRSRSVEPTLDDMALAVAESSELHLIADLDTLVSADNNAIWLEADPSSLY